MWVRLGDMEVAVLYCQGIQLSSQRGSAYVYM